MLHIVKWMLSITCFSCIIFALYILVFSSKEKRFHFAEHAQGAYISQKMFDVLLVQNPNWSNAYFEKSVAYNKRGDYAKGFELLNKAVEINPKLHLGYRAWLKLNKLKDYEGCINDLKKLDTLTPNFVDAPWGDNIHYLLGLSYKGLKEYDLAMAEFNKALKHDGTSFVNVNLFFHKGIISYHKNKFNEALTNFEALKNANYGKLTPEYCFWKGKTYYKLGRNDSALVYLNQSKLLYNSDGKLNDIYNEMQDELYMSDILEAISKL